MNDDDVREVIKVTNDHVGKLESLAHRMELAGEDEPEILAELLQQIDEMRAFIRRLSENELSPVAEDETPKRPGFVGEEFMI